MFPIKYMDNNLVSGANSVLMRYLNEKQLDAFVKVIKIANGNIS